MWAKLGLHDTSGGPWRLHEGGMSVLDNEERLIASCGFLPDVTKFQSKANAKLISLAPELVCALKDLVENVEAKNNGDHSGNVSIDDAVAILKQIDAYDETGDEE